MDAEVAGSGVSGDLLAHCIDTAMWLNGSIHDVSAGDQPYMDKWWVPGLSIGYEQSFIHQAANFLESLGSGEEFSPDFKDAFDTQKVCEAVLESAASISWKTTGL